MRLFGRKSSNQSSSSDQTAITPEKVLGVFSPAVDALQPDPTRECRRLAELEQIFIRSRVLESLNDVPFVVREIQKGNIVLLDITKLNDGREQSYLELKRIVERIRGETLSYGADIALVNDGCLIVTPSFVKM